ncbi:MAG: hypothetical protein ABSE52_12120 [Candidatus Dormibacteria bacterium]|jgi:hypothetical protein
MTTRRSVLGVSVALVATMTSACATVSFSWGPTPRPTAPSAATSGGSGAPSAASGTIALEYQEAAETISLTAADLSPFSVHSPVAAVPGAAASGWNVIYGSSIDVAHLTSGCLTPLSPEIAGWYRGYSYDLEPDDVDEGQGSLWVYVIDTPADATAEQAEVATAAYGLCWETQVTTDLTSGGSAVVVTGPTSIAVESVDAGVASYMRLYTTPYTFGGEAKTNYDSVVWLQYGRYRAILDLSTCCGQPPVSDFQPDAQLLATRMQAAPA